jgi:ABC-2 type transport system ATP-binding protein
MTLGRERTERAVGNGIEVEGLVRQFKKGPRAVDGISLSVAPGEIYGFLGPNGAGKSTTVLMLTTLLPPTAGTARVAGYDIVREGPKVRAAIGAALQEAALDPLLTGREHLKLQAALHGLPKSERIRRGDALLERVGLMEAADRKVGGYSGGMKRRLDLALALVHEPACCSSTSRRPDSTRRAGARSGTRLPGSRGRTA